MQKLKEMKMSKLGQKFAEIKKKKHKKQAK